MHAFSLATHPFSGPVALLFAEMRISSTRIAATGKVCSLKGDHILLALACPGIKVPRPKFTLDVRHSVQT